MLLVPVRITASPIHGLGVFAAAAIPRGTPIWTFQPGFDREFSTVDFAELPTPAQRHLRWYAYLDIQTGHWVLGGDHTGYMNHSSQPNTGAPPAGTSPVVTVALRDIAAGEELTCDYFAFDAEAAGKLSAK